MTVQELQSLLLVLSSNSPAFPVKLARLVGQREGGGDGDGALLSPPTLPPPSHNALCKFHFPPPPNLWLLLTPTPTPTPWHENRLTHCPALGKPFLRSWKKNL